MEIALRRETAEAIRVRTSNGVFRGEISAELGKIASKSEQTQSEIKEFAGANR
jgi:hypothetical protein